MERTQPIFLLPEETMRKSGKDAQQTNIAAAREVADAVRTTLGPKGMDKMLVDESGSVTVTNDGVTILNEMEVEHPCAKMIVEVARTQEDKVGDGTTTAVVLAGELLRKAESLLDHNIHPTVVAKGYLIAARKAEEILGTLARPAAGKDALASIALTAMTGKGVEQAREHLASLVVDAVTQLSRPARSSIRLVQQVGPGMASSELVPGLVLDKAPLGIERSEGARVALIDMPIEIKHTETDSRISITNPESLKGFLEMEERMLKEMVERIAGSGATVLFCQKGIDDLAAHLLARKGVLAVRRVRKSDMDALARSLGANVVSDLSELEPQDLGSCGLVEKVLVGTEEMTFVRDCPKKETLTLIVRGSTEHTAAEGMRAVEDAIGDVVSALASGTAVPGAGAIELELSRQLRGYAQGLCGREQLAVQAYAEALEVIPRTLAENAGLDPIDTMAQLKSAHEAGALAAGLDVFTGQTMDAWEAGVLEPLQVKSQALQSATDVATMILRIDDVIAAGRRRSERTAGRFDDGFK